MEQVMGGVTAAKGFDHVKVINSEQISGGQALIVLYAGKLAMEGHTAAEICRLVERIKKKIDSHYMLPAAEIFHQRGHLNDIFAGVCRLFGLHPEMTLEQGRMRMNGVRCGRMEGAWKRFIHWHLRHKGKISTDIVYITHAGCSVEQLELIRREVLRCVPFEKVIIQRTSVSIACNSGIGTFGMAYYLL